MNLKEYINGEVFDAYKYFGAHPTRNGIVFRVYAPNASKVTLTGEFNFWTETEMKKLPGGVYEYETSQTSAGQLYKYIIYSKRNSRTEHCDPYGFELERGSGHCSIIRDMNRYVFHDEEWMKKRTLNTDQPLNIYEMHYGSWMKEDSWRWLNYEEMADYLIDYLRKFSFSHVEFLPLTEHPMDASWGYQVTGYFAATSRYGNCDHLKYLIDRLHNAGIGVIFDIVAAHYSVDSYGLKTFDGSPMYESRDKKRQKSDWGSYFFDHEKGHVRSFLQSCANFWLSEYHFDGLRVDAVSNLIYWHGDGSQGENTGGITFVKNMNRGLSQLHPTAMLIAEDSTMYPGCTKPVEHGGLGFTYKWDMAWTFDTMSYFGKRGKKKQGNSRLLTNSTDYYPYERFILPVSHDTVGRGHDSLMDFMPGFYSQRLKGTKLFYTYMIVHPGKCLSFMGTEFAALNNWDERTELDWTLFQDADHREFSVYIEELNRIYRDNPALYQNDDDDWSYHWLVCDDDGDCVYSMIRHSVGQHIVAVWNFSNEKRSKFIPIEHLKSVKPLIHSEWTRFGGGVKEYSVNYKYDPNGITINLPSLTSELFEVEFE